ncbi:MAG: hypothetical protein GY797_16175 [Deltaproteobacteria bacterium]|nr:hypothetical protein [Deltaproteobacteria bacterium]
MEKKMVQCEDGRRRQARIQGDPKKDGDFSTWQAAIRFKGKHVSGDAWYSHKTKTWYFSSDPGGKHSHLMDRIQSSSRIESISRLQGQLETLESQHTKHVNAMNALSVEIASIKEEITQLERGAPIESAASLKSSRKIRMV